jgi:site-specific recombinase XerD
VASGEEGPFALPRAKIGGCGGSLREVQDFAGHSSLWMTQQYIVVSEVANRKVVDTMWDDD